MTLARSKLAIVQVVHMLPSMRHSNPGNAATTQGTQGADDTRLTYTVQPLFDEEAGLDNVPA